MLKTSKINKHLIVATTLTASVYLVMSPLLANAQQAPPAAPAGSTIEQRIAQRKAERTITLADKDQKRLQTTCTSAQAKVRELQRKTTDVTTNRLKVYRQIQARLWVSVGKLKLAQKDTFNLEKQLTVYTQQVDQFDATAQGYQQALDDTALINCQADPVGFKALLETAKLYNTALRAQSSALRSYVVDTIKPSLSDYATQLKGGEGS